MMYFELFDHDRRSLSYIQLGSMTENEDDYRLLFAEKGFSYEIIDEYNKPDDFAERFDSKPLKKIISILTEKFFNKDGIGLSTWLEGKKDYGYIKAGIDKEGNMLAICKANVKGKTQIKKVKMSSQEFNDFAKQFKSKLENKASADIFVTKKAKQILQRTNHATRT